MSRYTCRSWFLDFIAFCRCSAGVALHPLNILVSHLPPPCPRRCRTQIWVWKGVALHGGVAATVAGVALHCATKSPSQIVASWGCFRFLFCRPCVLMSLLCLLPTCMLQIGLKTEHASDQSVAHLSAPKSRIAVRWRFLPQTRVSQGIPQRGPICPFSSQKKSRFASDFLRRGNSASWGLEKSRDFWGSGKNRRRNRRESRDFGALRVAHWLSLSARTTDWFWMRLFCLQLRSFCLRFVFFTYGGGTVSKKDQT